MAAEAVEDGDWTRDEAEAFKESWKLLLMPMLFLRLQKKQGLVFLLMTWRTLNQNFQMRNWKAWLVVILFLEELRDLAGERTAGGELSDEELEGVTGG